MAKEKERKLAEHYYVEKNRTAREVAALVGVTEATVSAWVSKGGWKARREARAASPSERVGNIREVISQLAADRIELGQQLSEALKVGYTKEAGEIRKRMAALDDGVAKWNKALGNAIGEARVPLATYLDVMERIFNDMREFDEKLYLQTIDFQDHHVNSISQHEANR